MASPITFSQFFKSICERNGWSSMRNDVVQVKLSSLEKLCEQAYAKGFEFGQLSKPKEQSFEDYLESLKAKT
jgi:hypothetical protein